MKKFFLTFEDLWVAITFAEADEYETPTGNIQQNQYREILGFHAL